MTIDIKTDNIFLSTYDRFRFLHNPHIKERTIQGN